MAHPDDAEFSCGGTLALLAGRGWAIHIATMSAGDCGSKDLGSDEISVIRRQEATRAAAVLKGSYHCLECKDMFILHDRPTLLKVVALVRRVRPALVLTHSPIDYMVDHETTSRLAQSACFAAGMPNIGTGEVQPWDDISHLVYCDPMEGKDNFGQAVLPHFVVDIASSWETKREMLCCHESQREWLLRHHGLDEYTESARRWAQVRGQLADLAMGEGFRQHLGHAFPQTNILKAELDAYVHVMDRSAEPHE